MRDHHLDRVAGLQLVAHPVREQPAPDPLYRHHPVSFGRRGAERVIAPDFLAIDRCAERQVLTRAERERLPKLCRNFKSDRIGVRSFRNDFGDLQRVEVDAHYQTASG